jgi:hypothetical protein
VKLLCVLVVLALSTGCTATCVRDSDCIGNAICIDDRCILVARGDAGRGTPNAGGSNTAGSGAAGQAGSTQGGAGGASTDPRLNLDAAADADPAGGSQ